MTIKRRSPEQIDDTKGIHDIILNRIITPDGTELISFHRHDFKAHTDKNGELYAVDGGREYLRRIGLSDYKEASVFANDDYAVIRDAYYRAHSIHSKPIANEHLSYVKQDNDGMRFIPLSHINDEWLKNIIIYNHDRNIDASWYEKELNYRETNKIKVED